MRPGRLQLGRVPVSATTQQALAKVVTFQEMAIAGWFSLSEPGHEVASPSYGQSPRAGTRILLRGVGGHMLGRVRGVSNARRAGQ